MPEHGREDADFAVCCAVPLDAPGVTIVARPAGRPGENGAVFTGKYGQSTGVVLFDNVFVPHERIFLAGEWEHSGFLTTTYATHHRHSCIGARAGFGDLLIGAGVLMYEANGLNASLHGHVRDAMVELIKIVEGFFACGVAASVYGLKDGSGNIQPDSVFSNVGKLLLATQIYDMQRLAHYVSGGLVVALPGPEEDHNPATQARLSAVLAGRQDIPARRRLEVARLLEDLTASDSAGWYSIISLHGGGSPEAMKREIWRQYPLEDKVALVEGLLERGVAGDIARPRPSARPLLYYRLPSAGAATCHHRDLRSGGVREVKGSAFQKTQVPAMTTTAPEQARLRELPEPAREQVRGGWRRGPDLHGGGGDYWHRPCRRSLRRGRCRRTSYSRACRAVRTVWRRRPVGWPQSWGTCAAGGGPGQRLASGDRFQGRASGSGIRDRLEARDSGDVTGLRSWSRSAPRGLRPGTPAPSCVPATEGMTSSPGPAENE